MITALNHESVYMSNLLGILVTLVWIAGSFWRFKGRHISKEDRLLRSMGLLTLTCCLADPLCYYFDGKSGMLAAFFVWGGNLWLFALQLAVPLLWFEFLTLHLYGSVNKYYAGVLYGMIGVCYGLLIINFFTPIIFGVTEQNNYYRGDFYWLFFAMNLLIILASIVAYIRAKQKGGLLKFFPLLVFAIPMVIGLFIQTVFHGVSMAWPCLSISLCGVSIGLAGEKVFRDRLTGLYNRSYLEEVKEKADKTGHQEYFTVIMTDIDGFKRINDTFGHSVGDQALIETARLLRENVGALGVVIRYGGDEFMILLNTADEAEADRIMGQIIEGLEAFNKAAERPYKLHLSIGSCLIDLEEESLDRIFDEVDRRMYEDKARYYEEHPEIERRTR